MGVVQSVLWGGTRGGEADAVVGAKRARDGVTKLAIVAPREEGRVGKKARKEMNREAQMALQREREEQKRADRRALQQAPKDLRSPEELRAYVRVVNDNMIEIAQGLVPNMIAPARCFVNAPLYRTLMEELVGSTGEKGQTSAMLPSLKQVANVASLPGVVGSVAMPDIHCGYGFAIGNVAAVDMDAPGAVVSPGGVGFDINCGMRLIRTNLTKEDILQPGVQAKLADTLFKEVPTGVGCSSSFHCTKERLDDILTHGMAALQDTEYVWPEDAAHVEEGGCISGADARKVSDRAKKRGIPQIGTLGSGNHFSEVQVVEEIFNPEAAAAMGISQVGQVCIMIHSGSRGLGHQVCTDYLQQIDKFLSEHPLELNDRQLACVPIHSSIGQSYLSAMAAAANFAFCNRSMMTAQVRSAFSKVFGKPARDMDMHVVYDVCHNIAKIEEHLRPGSKTETFSALVHRKGATRAFGPGHPSLPDDYKACGQPVIVGGSMGTFSYVLTGTQVAMETTFGSTCHGAGRQLSRVQALRKLEGKDVLEAMKRKGIELRVRNAKLVAEEACEAYKDVSDVTDVCQDAGISLKCVKLRSLVVVKG
ncbi:tRNA-splicing ligase RtcB-like 1 [Porphyridium purpureum]|uniref:RNA-splicing ligase RtcB homolog n=1 Tax=Porphyridium purpureum TaxID=35688 RepID=A0A5J4YLU4_PORPP|nr:tRNA-splicing ligase RtcB-like 1 [Porphyridium purpureum]|eukprot:POR9323..scf210_14